MMKAELFGFCKSECQVYLWLYRSVEIASTEDEVRFLDASAIEAIKAIKKGSERKSA